MAIYIGFKGDHVGGGSSVYQALIQYMMHPLQLPFPETAAILSTHFCPQIFCSTIRIVVMRPKPFSQLQKSSGFLQPQQNSGFKIPLSAVQPDTIPCLQPLNTLAVR